MPDWRDTYEDYRREVDDYDAAVRRNRRRAFLWSVFVLAVVVVALACGLGR